MTRATPRCSGRCRRRGTRAGTRGRSARACSRTSPAGRRRETPRRRRAPRPCEFAARSRRRLSRTTCTSRPPSSCRCAHVRRRARGAWYRPVCAPPGTSTRTRRGSPSPRLRRRTFFESRRRRPLRRRARVSRRSRRPRARRHHLARGRLPRPEHVPQRRDLLVRRLREQVVQVQRLVLRLRRPLLVERVHGVPVPEPNPVAVHRELIVHVARGLPVREHHRDVQRPEELQRRQRGRVRHRLRLRRALREVRRRRRRALLRGVQQQRRGSRLRGVQQRFPPEGPRRGGEAGPRRGRAGSGAGAGGRSRGRSRGSLGEGIDRGSRGVERARSRDDSGEGGGGRDGRTDGDAHQLDAVAHLVPSRDAALRVAVRGPVRARRLLVAAVAPGGEGGERARGRQSCRTAVRSEEALKRKKNAMPAPVGSDAPAVRAVRRVRRLRELEHRARVTRVRVIHERVVADHACARERARGRGESVRTSDLASAGRGTRRFSTLAAGNARAGGDETRWEASERRRGRADSNTAPRAREIARRDDA
eukprot:30911-Pelagococcus_subviridis.AAC.13